MKIIADDHTFNALVTNIIEAGQKFGGTPDSTPQADKAENALQSSISALHAYTEAVITEAVRDASTASK